jgi:putative hydrolase of the HAD superfamily
MIHAVAFDLDNTLYDHAQFVRGAYRDVSETAARLTGVDAEAFFERIFGDWQRLTSRANSIFTDALRDLGVWEAGLDLELVVAYREHCPTELRAYPGVDDGLHRLRDRGVPLGLLSDGRVAVQQRKLQALGLEDAFDVVIITGELGSAFYKPHPAGFELLVERLGTNPAAMAYVGDNPLVDFAPAKQLGMTTIRVRTAEYSRESQGSQWIDREFGQPYEAMEWAVRQSQGRQVL